MAEVGSSSVPALAISGLDANHVVLHLAQRTVRPASPNEAGSIM